MKKTKNQKKKRRLRSLILLLFLTIIMFGTSTYAWFTANRYVTIESLDVHVEASNGLQISTNAVNWKSVITTADITTGAYTGHVNQLPGTVTAVSTDGVIDQTTKKMNMYLGTVGNDATTGDYNITTALETDTAGTSGNYIAFDVFLRVDSAMTVYLTTDSNVTFKTNTEDRGLKNAARVAWYSLGNTAATSATNVMTGLNSAPASASIWEPNIDSHETIVTTSVAPDYGVTIPATGATPYYGVNKVISTAVDLKELVNHTNTTDATLVTPTISTTENFSTYQTFMSLSAGVTKVRFYMWIEGQDIDCENNATGSDISYNIQLSTLSAPAASNP